jgi:hypothetical protein
VFHSLNNWGQLFYNAGRELVTGPSWEMETNTPKLPREDSNPQTVSFLRLLLSRTTFWNPMGVFFGMLVLTGMFLAMALVVWRRFF